MLYKVLKDGIRQRNSEGGLSSPKVGEVIKVSDAAAPSLIADGWIAPSGVTDHGEQEPEPRRKKKAWLGLGGDAPPAPLGQGEASVPPPVTPKGEPNGGTQ
jgi:hypothetical protein